jgi:hypothetical protein
LEVAQSVVDAKLVLKNVASLIEPGMYEHPGGMLLIEFTWKSRPLLSAMVLHSSSVRCASQSMTASCNGCTGGGGVGGDGADGGGDGSAGGGDGGGAGGVAGGAMPQMQWWRVWSPQFWASMPTMPELNHTVPSMVKYRQPNGEVVTPTL